MEVDSAFADPDFDGVPVQIYDPDDDDSIVPPDEGDTEPGENEILVDPGNDITINLDEPSVETPIDLVPHKARARDIDVALSNSFGFGGTNASLVFRRVAA